MKYNEKQKVTIQSKDWYEQSKQPNGFIIFKEGNKIATFSPGMVKFCGQTFTVNKVVTGSSIYPDHYTFVEDGGAYKWTDEMIADQAGQDAQTYVGGAASATTPKPVEQPKPEPKPVEQPKPAPKPVEKPSPKPVEQPKPEQKPVEQPKQEPKPNPKPEPKPVEQPKQEPKSAPKPEPEQKTTELPEPKRKQVPENHHKGEETDSESAFETFTILLKPKNGATLENCTVQAFKIMSNNVVFPAASFDFGGFEVTISRK